MTIPDWICKAVCGGLNLDELNNGESNIENPADFNENSNTSNLFKTEEE